MKNFPIPAPLKPASNYWSLGPVQTPSLPKDEALPTFSIVTPCYNYGRFLERTLRSVLLQNYPNIEYHVVDGGSSDETVSILKHYQSHLASWTSEPDQGQTDAINKGFARCTGDIFIWLNADDTFAHPDVLAEVARHFQKGTQFLVGDICMRRPDGSVIEEMRPACTSHPVTFAQYLHYWEHACIPQPGAFVSRAIAAKAFPLSPELKILMDYQFFLRCLAQNPSSHWEPHVFTDFLVHGANISCSEQSPAFSAWEREFDFVFTQEAEKLPAHQRQPYLRAYRRHRTLKRLMHHQPPPASIFTAIADNPSLLRESLTWKLLAKAAVGETIYNSLKKRLR